MKARTRLENTIDRSPEETSLLVVSDSHVGSLLAADIDSVRTHLITDSSTVALQTPDNVRKTVGNVTSAEILGAGAGATAAVVALQRDRQALLVAQLLRTRFEIDELLISVNDPQRREAFEDIATTIVCVSTCLSTELGDAVKQTLSEPRSHS